MRRTIARRTCCHICEKSFAPEYPICGSAIIVISPIDTAVQRIQIVTFYIPIEFYNLSGYADFIIKEIATVYDGHVDVLPITKEKYILFVKHIQNTTEKESRNCIKL